MATNHQILLYDDYCPLCSWYSGLFVKLGLLEKENRVPFSKADINILTSIDIERGKDEIPLFNASNGTTLYGIDALLEILGKKCSIIRTTGNWKPVNWFLKKLYKFISYNRKVIVARKCGPGTFDCSPVFSTPYRLLFISLFLVFNSLMLFPLHENLFSHLSFYHISAMELQLAHLAFVFINIIMATALRRKDAFEYLGQVNVLALIVILLLSCFTFINSLLLLPEILIAGVLGLFSAFVIMEYFRRMKYADILKRYSPIIAVNIVCLLIFLGYVFH